jgi:hypothetical protein
MSAYFVIEPGALRRAKVPFVEHASGRLLQQTQVLVRELERTKHPIPRAEIARILRPFLASPTPAVFVAASAMLGALGRGIMMGQRLDEQRERILENALEHIEGSSSAGAILKGSLEHGARDRKASARIHALSCLVGAYEELEARAQLERDALRRKLGLAR